MSTPTPDYAELAKRLRRYPACRKTAWELYEEGFCYDDEMDNGPIEKLVLEVASALEALSTPSQQPDAKQYESLRAFVWAVLEERADGLGEIDGGWLQDTLEKHGLLVPVEVTEPCAPEGPDGESACTCVEYGDFPQTCYRTAEWLKRND